MDLCLRADPNGLDPGQAVPELFYPNKPPPNQIVSTTVLAKINLKRELERLPTGSVVASGQLHLGDWVKVCYDEGNKPPAFVNLSFVVPTNLTQSDTQTVCVILSGHQHLLPLSHPSVLCVPHLPRLNDTKLVMITGRGDQRKHKELCDNGSIVNMDYEWQAPSKIFLSKIEKARISWNLQVFTATIVLICVVYIFYRHLVTRRAVTITTDGYQLPQIT